MVLNRSKQGKDLRIEWDQPPMRCADCCCDSIGDEVFRAYYPSANEPPLHFCPDCWGLRQVRTQRMGICFTAVVVLGGLGVAAALPLGRETLLARVALLLIGAYFVSTFLHELGHASMSWLLGLRVLRISFGAGRPLWRWTVGGVGVELCSYPLSGFVEHLAGSRAQGALVTLAGPGANIVLFGLGWGLAIGAGMPAQVGIEAIGPWHALLAVNGIIVFQNLLPFEIPVSEEGPGGPPKFVNNDGMNLYRLLRGKSPS